MQPPQWAMPHWVIWLSLFVPDIVEVAPRVQVNPLNQRQRHNRVPAYIRQHALLQMPRAAPNSLKSLKIQLLT